MVFFFFFALVDRRDACISDFFFLLLGWNIVSAAICVRVEYLNILSSYILLHLMITRKKIPSKNKNKKNGKEEEKLPIWTLIVLCTWFVAIRDQHINGTNNQKKKKNVCVHQNDHVLRTPSKINKTTKIYVFLIISYRF